MENSNNKSITLTAFAWVGFLMMIGGVIILILGIVPDAPFQIEYNTLKMSTPQTGLVLAFLGAMVGYIATKNSANVAVVFSGSTSSEEKFKRNLRKASIVIGVLAVILLILFYILHI